MNEAHFEISYPHSLTCYNCYINKVMRYGSDLLGGRVCHQIKLEVVGVAYIRLTVRMIFIHFVL